MIQHKHECKRICRRILTFFFVVWISKRLKTTNNNAIHCVGLNKWPSSSLHGSTVITSEHKTEMLVVWSWWRPINRQWFSDLKLSPYCASRQWYRMPLKQTPLNTQFHSKETNSILWNVENDDSIVVRSDQRNATVPFWLIMHAIGKRMERKIHRTIFRIYLSCNMQKAWKCVLLFSNWIAQNTCIH